MNQTYDTALGSTSTENLMRLMQEDPQLQSLLIALQTAAKPVQEGNVGVP
jgi:hypothetical protein